VTFRALVEVRKHPGIADPEGATIERSLPALGFSGVSDVHVGMAFRFTVEAPDEAAARATVQALAERLLANPVLEEVSVTVSAVEGAPA
jgi:phosphoribosylformylglycinamidine synthase PurS subunit